MKRKHYLKSTGFIIVALILLSGCSSTTLIQSYPSGAKVFINGSPVGKTPYWYSDSKIMGSVTDIDLVKDGYEPLYTSIYRDERVDVGAIAGGFCFGIPFLWSLRYNPVHNYELIPLTTQKPQYEEYNFQNEKQKQDNLQQNTDVNTSSKADRLRELKLMLDENLINKEDFEKQKQRILNEI